MVADIDDPDRLAFPLRRGLAWRRLRSELFEPDAEGNVDSSDLLPGIASLVVGGTEESHFRDNIAAVDITLTAEELHRIYDQPAAATNRRENSS